MKHYELTFAPRARRAWDKLTPETKQQLAKRLAERQSQPRIASARLSRMGDCYKIKLQAAGLRLVYRVEEQKLLILVLAVGKRERGEIYLEAIRELRNLDD